MNKEELMKYCLSKKGAYIDYPFASSKYPVVKIKNENTGKNRIFAEIFTLNDVDMVTFSTDFELANMLRNQFCDVIKRGYHCPPIQAKYKSTAIIDKLTTDTLKNLIDISYDIAQDKLKMIKAD